MHKKIVSNLFLIEIQLIYNVVLVSGAQQSDSIIYIYTHKYTTHTHTHTHTYTYIYLDSFPLQVNTDIEYRSLCYVLYSRSLLFICFMQDCFPSFAFTNNSAVSTLKETSLHMCVYIYKKNGYKWIYWVKGSVPSLSSSPKGDLQM